MARFIPLLPLAGLLPGRGKCVSAEGRDFAVFQVEGEIFAIDESCPHRGGPLSEGDVTGCVVYCPLHAWSFDLRTGISPGNPKASVQTYPVRIAGGTLEIGLEEEPAVKATPDPDPWTSGR
jgi:nitrite reductase/ring-hydroxylating ferredoxin subunit